MFSVYQIKSLTTGKSYVGVTKATIKARWRQHIKLARSRKKRGALQSAILKYGPGDFTVAEIFCTDDLSAAHAAERCLVATLDAMVPAGYNMTSGGEANGGLEISDETRKRMRNARATHPPRTEESREKYRQAKIRDWQDPAFRERVLRKVATEGQSPAQKAHFQKVRQGFGGRKHSDETRAKMKAEWDARRGHMRGVTRPPEVGEKISAAKRGKPSKLKGRKMTPEQIETRRIARWGR